MHYMVELHYSKERRDAALQYFWKHGSTHYDGKVTLSGAWVATRDLIAYALVVARNAEEVSKAVEPLREFGDVIYRQVTSIDQI